MAGYTTTAAATYSNIEEIFWGSEIKGMSVFDHCTLPSIADAKRVHWAMMKALTILFAFQTVVHGFGQIADKGDLKRVADDTLATDMARLSPRVRQLIDLARGTPPEISSDVLLLMATSVHVPSKRIKLMLMEEAFENAAYAQQPIKKRTLPSIQVDSRPGYQSRGFALDRDTVSLQSRAVSAILIYEPKKALMYFGRIQMKLQPLNCSDSLTYDVAQYYATALEVLSSSFTVSDQRRGDHIAFLELLLTQVHSPAQIAPAAKLLLSVADRWDVADTSRLAGVFGGAMDRIDGDTRSFGVATHRSSAGDMGGLFLKLTAKQIPVRGLFDAYNRYLVRHLKGSQCADNPNAIVSAEKLPEYLVYLVYKLTPQLFPAGDVSPIDVKSLKPASIVAAAPVVNYWQTPTTSAIMRALKRLRFGEGIAPLSESSRATVEWQAEFKQVLERIRDWKREEEPERDFYAQKGQALLALTQLAPDGMHSSVLSALLSTIQASNLRSTSVAEWLVFLRGAISDASLHRTGSLSDVWDQMYSTGGPAIQVYADLNRLGLYN